MSQLICPRHALTLQPVKEGQWKGRLYVCPERICDYTYLRAVNEKLPGLDPGRQYTAVRAAESQLVSQWRQWGALQGYTVLAIGQQVHYLTCPCCQTKIKRITCPACHETTPYRILSQSTTGAPDLFWHHPRWRDESGKPNVWKGIEAKASASSEVRAQQQTLAQKGAVDIVWTLEMLQEVLNHPPSHP